MSRLQKVQFGNNHRTIVYLQNSGFNNGDTFNSIILSCSGNMEEINNIVIRTTKFIKNHHITNPIKWNNLMNKELLYNENFEGEIIGNQLRDKCFIIDEVDFQGGHIFGGKNGDKFTQLPYLKSRHLPMEMTKKYSTVMGICKFEGDHKCDIEVRKGSVNQIREYQNVITKMLVNRDINKWENTSHRKKGLITLELAKIKEEMSDDEK